MYKTIEKIIIELYDKNALTYDVLDIIFKNLKTIPSDSMSIKTVDGITFDSIIILNYNPELYFELKEKVFNEPPSSISPREKLNLLIKNSDWLINFKSELFLSK